MEINGYCNITDRFVMRTAQAAPMLVHGPTRTLSFYNQELGGFINVYAEAFLGF